MTEPAHILVVDDDPASRRLFLVLLSDMGYRVSMAMSGEEALVYVDLITPDLILMDLLLPGITGQEVTRRIKTDPLKTFIPIILITGHSHQGSKVPALDAGADDVLIKPVDPNELLARVRAMLRLQRSQRSLRNEQRKTQLLLGLTRELATTLDLDKLLAHFLDRLVDAIGATHASVLLTTDDRLRLYTSTNLELSAALRTVLHRRISHQVLDKREPLVIADIQKSPYWSGELAHEAPFRSIAAIPIMRDEQTLGVITLAHHTPGYFNAEHLELLNSVAVQQAIALDNAELFRLIQNQRDLLARRTEELQQINQVSRLLTELMRPEQLFRLVVHLIHHTFGYPKVALLLCDGNDLVVRAVAGEAHDQVGHHTPGGQGIAGWVVAHREPLCVPDLQQAPPPLLEPAEDTSRSVLAIPILGAHKIFGTLKVASDAVDAFGANDIRLLNTLASQLGVAIESARLLDAEERRARQLDQINSLSIALTARLDMTENLQIAVDAIAAIFRIEQCGICVASGREQAISFHTRNQPAAEPAPQLQQVLPLNQLATTLELSEPAIVSVADCEQLQPLREQLRQLGVEELALAPLLANGHTIGMIGLDLTNHPESFGRSELTLLETIASLLAQVMENARLYRDVADERSTLDTVLSSAADPILLIDAHNRLLLANRAAEQLLALNIRIGHPLDPLSTPPELLLALNENGHAGKTAREVTLAGDETFSISVAPVRGTDNELLGRVAVLQDISAIKELERREQERLRSVLRRYVSPQIVEELLADGGDFGTPTECEVVVLFADLRQYTTLAEGLAPRVLVEHVLNRYFTKMTEVLYHHGGMIDKFLGDGIVGVFGTPISREDDAQRSLAAAVDLQRAFAALRRSWQSELQLDIGMGIGMAHGRAVVGNIGSKQRLDYTVIGDVVNTASRLNGIAQPGQIIVSYHLIDALPAHWRSPWPMRRLERVQLKGKQEPHLIYRIEYEETVEARG